MFINIGFGNFINEKQIISICRSDSSPMKRLISDARNMGKAIDATQGRKTKSVISTADGMVVLSALMPETISARCNGTAVQKDENNSDTGENEACDE